MANRFNIILVRINLFLNENQGTLGERSGINHIPRDHVSASGKQPKDSEK